MELLLQGDGGVESPEYLSSQARQQGGTTAAYSTSPPGGRRGNHTYVGHEDWNETGVKRYVLKH